MAVMKKLGRPVPGDTKDAEPIPPWRAIAARTHRRRPEYPRWLVPQPCTIRTWKVPALVRRALAEHLTRRLRADHASAEIPANDLEVEDTQRALVTLVPIPICPVPNPGLRAAMTGSCFRPTTLLRVGAELTRGFWIGELRKRADARSSATTQAVRSTNRRSVDLILQRTRRIGEVRLQLGPRRDATPGHDRP